MNAASAPLDTNTLPDGLVLTGQFLSGKEQPGNFKEGTSGERWPSKYVVSLLVGDRTVQVEYKDENVANDLIGLSTLEPMDRISIPVGTRGAKGYVFFYGRRG